VRARTQGQADDIDGVTFVRNQSEDAGDISVDSLRPGDLIEVHLEAVVTDYDFEGTLVRHVSSAPVASPTRAPRTLPVMSTVSAFGR
jgi:hypothetical protein